MTTVEVRMVGTSFLYNFNLVLWVPRPRNVPKERQEDLLKRKGDGNVLLFRYRLKGGTASETSRWRKVPSMPWGYVRIVVACPVQPRWAASLSRMQIQPRNHEVTLKGRST